MRWQLRDEKKEGHFLTIEKEAAACSNSPTSPASVKYFPEQIPSSSGDTTSSDTADSSSTLDEIFCRGTEGKPWLKPFVWQKPACGRAAQVGLRTWKVTQPTGRYLRSSSMLRYSATSAALWTRHWAASAWLFLSECFPAMFCSQVSLKSGDVWYPLAILLRRRFYICIMTNVRIFECIKKIVWQMKLLHGTEQISVSKYRAKKASNPTCTSNR